MNHIKFCSNFVRKCYVVDSQLSYNGNVLNPDTAVHMAKRYRSETRPAIVGLSL